jgi:hypothetical protein
LRKLYYEKKNLNAHGSSDKLLLLHKNNRILVDHCRSTKFQLMINFEKKAG